jgi:hypothetical protein
MELRSPLPKSRHDLPLRAAIARLVRRILHSRATTLRLVRNFLHSRAQPRAADCGGRSKALFD